MIARDLWFGPQSKILATPIKFADLYIKTMVALKQSNEILYCAVTNLVKTISIFQIYKGRIWKLKNCNNHWKKINIKCIILYQKNEIENFLVLVID